MQPPDREPVLNPLGTQPERQQLPPRYHAMLPFRKRLSRRAPLLNTSPRHRGYKRSAVADSSRRWVCQRLVERIPINSIVRMAYGDKIRSTHLS